MSQISLKNYPELVLLLEEGETLASFTKLAPEVILLRWVNYHLTAAGVSKRMSNFTTDVMVCNILYLGSFFKIPMTFAHPPSNALFWVFI